MGVPYAPRAIRRIRETASQVGLTIEQRKENMEAAFFAKEQLAGGKHILVVDDVLTTGATLDAVAMALKAAGSVKVTGLVVARA
ncbi:MAG: phosphoribosyltransferase family protein [Anaerolineales bacterium]|jgi:predicted amidophosphoribosyltransferase